MLPRWIFVVLSPSVLPQNDLMRSPSIAFWKPKIKVRTLILIVTVCLLSPALRIHYPTVSRCLLFLLLISFFPFSECAYSACLLLLWNVRDAIWTLLCRKIVTGQETHRFQRSRVLVQFNVSQHLNDMKYQVGQGYIFHSNRDEMSEPDCACCWGI